MQTQQTDTPLNVGDLEQAKVGLDTDLLIGMASGAKQNLEVNFRVFRQNQFHPMAPDLLKRAVEADRELEQIEIALKGGKVSPELQRAIERRQS